MHASSAGDSSRDIFAWYAAGCGEAAVAMALLVASLPFVIEKVLSLMNAGSGTSQMVMSGTKFITGQPGCGKTTCVKRLLEVLAAGELNKVGAAAAATTSQMPAFRWTGFYTDGEASHASAPLSFLRCCCQFLRAVCPECVDSNQSTQTRCLA